MDSTVESREDDPVDDGVSLADLAEGARKVFENASDLYDEAVLLQDGGALCRALSLHQISLEECAKVDMLGALAVGLFMGEELSRKSIQRAFSNHRAKNFTNAYLRPPGDREKEARGDKRWADAMEAFRAQQRQFHHESNTRKNASLYVDLTDEGFLKPRDRITRSMIVEIRADNERYLSGAEMYVRMLARWQKAPDVVKDLLKDFASTAESVRASTDDHEEALSLLMDAVFERAASIGYANHMVAPDEDTNLG